EGTFRICDFVAWTIGKEVAGAPRCELYWPEKKRDAACAACAEFLRHYGDHVGSRGAMRLPQLDKPATREQVRKGEAIFSLEGERQVRLVKLSDWPTAALWVTLKDLPYEARTVDPKTEKETTTLAYRQDGKVYQAEEVLTNGKWQRYYGFAASHPLAPLPASEIEFPPPEPGWGQPPEWVRLTERFDGRLEPTLLKDHLEEDAVPRWPSGSGPSCTLELWNHSGMEGTLPDLKAAVRLRLYYSP